MDGWMDTDWMCGPLLDAALVLVASAARAAVLLLPVVGQVCRIG